MITPIVYVRRRVFTALHCGRADTGPAHCDELDCRWCNVCRRHLTGIELEWKTVEILERAIVLRTGPGGLHISADDPMVPVVLKTKTLSFVLPRKDES